MSPGASCNMRLCLMQTACSCRRTSLAMPVQGINQHLPESVRALAVQRVNKGFNARERCGTRTYHYFLPAAALDLAGDGEP